MINKRFKDVNPGLNFTLNRAENDKDVFVCQYFTKNQITEITELKNSSKIFKL